MMSLNQSHYNWIRSDDGGGGGGGLNRITLTWQPLMSQNESYIYRLTIVKKKK